MPKELKSNFFNLKTTLCHIRLATMQYCRVTIQPNQTDRDKRLTLKIHQRH